MSTTLMYHAFGLKAYRYMRAEYVNGAIFFHVRRKKHISIVRIAGAGM